MSYKATTYQFEKVGIPDAASGSNSRAFNVPRGAKTAVFFVPALTGGATCKLQVLQPADNDQVPDVWVDANAVIYSVGAVIGTMTLAGYAASTAYIMPIQGLGGAVMRFVATVAQGATVDFFTIYIVWGLDR